MNPNQRPDEDLFADLLAAYDADLAAGRVPGNTPVPVSPGLQERLDRVLPCLDLLEQLWPRHKEKTRRMFATFRPATRQIVPVPVRLVRFDIVRELGRGGFGIVYLAEDPLLKRQVAVKVPRPEVLLNQDLRQRFLREARASASLDHPNLVRLLEAGEQDGLCYLVSAYVAGPSLRRWLEERPEAVPIKPAVRLVADLAGAVAYIHDQGILHRDIKPSNVLLEESPARKDSLGVPRLTDFGLAKITTEEPGLTASQERMGTVLYMSPEQAAGKQADVGPATDVYSLGVVLYEMLTGRVPFLGENDLDTLRRIATDDPLPPRRLRPAVAPDLEAVCLKCLEKQPGKRYSSARELQEDLERYLEGKPTRARPLTVWQRGAKWASRRPALAALVAVLILTLTTLLAGAAWHLQQLEQLNLALQDVNFALQEETDKARKEAKKAAAEKEKAEDRAREVKLQAYVGAIWQAKSMAKIRNAGLIVEMLNQFRPGPGEEDLRGFEWYYLWERAKEAMVLRGHRGSVDAVAVSPDGKLIASGATDGLIVLWESATGKKLRKLGPFPGKITALAFSPDQSSLAAACETKKEGVVICWEVKSLEQKYRLNLLPNESMRLAWSPDGQWLAIAATRSGDNSQISCRRADTGARVWEKKSKGGLFADIDFAPDSKELAVGGLQVAIDDLSRGDYLLVLDAATGQLTRLLEAPNALAFNNVTYAPSGKTIFFGGKNDDLYRWDIYAPAHGLIGSSTVGLLGPTGGQGPFLATGALVPGREKLTTLTKITSFADPISDIAVSPDGNLLVVAATEFLFGEPSAGVFFFHGKDNRYLEKAYLNRTYNLAFDPNGQFLVMGGTKGVTVLSLADIDNMEYGANKEEVWGLDFSPDGKTLASAGDDHLVHLWNTSTYKKNKTLNGHTSLVTGVAYSPDGKLLASCSYDHTVQLWDTASGAVVKTLQGDMKSLRCQAFSPDGKYLAVGGKDNMVTLWDVAAGKVVKTLRNHTNIIHAVAFSPDGKFLVSGSDDRTAILWEVATGQPVQTFKELSIVRSVAFSPDGGSLALGIGFGAIKLYDLKTKMQTVLLNHHDSVRSVAFSPDGKTLASCSDDGSVRLWHVESGRELFPLVQGTATPYSAVAFSRDGQMFAYANYNGFVNISRVRKE